MWEYMMQITADLNVHGASQEIPFLPAGRYSATISTVAKHVERLSWGDCGEPEIVVTLTNIKKLEDKDMVTKYDFDRMDTAVSNDGEYFVGLSTTQVDTLNIYKYSRRSGCTLGQEPIARVSRTTGWVEVLEALDFNVPKFPFINTSDRHTLELLKSMGVPYLYASGDCRRNTVRVWPTKPVKMDCMYLTNVFSSDLADFLNNTKRTNIDFVLGLK